jgi:hypothetical protein
LNQPSHSAEATRPMPAGGPRPALRVPTPPTYRFVMADDPRLWPADAGPGGLLRVSEGEQLDGFDRLTQDACALIVICGIRQVAAVRRASALARSRGQARVAVVPLVLGPAGHGGSRHWHRNCWRWPRSARSLRSLRVCRPSRGRCSIWGWWPVWPRSITRVALRHHLLSYLPGRRLFVVQIALGRDRPGQPGRRAEPRGVAAAPTGVRRRLRRRGDRGW